MAAGFAQVTGDIVVMFDADGSADPAEIPVFVEALVGGADFAKGSRFCPGGGSSDITPIRNVGNKFLNTVMNVSFRTRFTDLCYGYNAFWADMIPLLDLPDHELVVPRDVGMLWGDGFEIETLINCRFAVAGATIAEVPSVERDRIYGRSNLHAVSDGLRVLRTLRAEYARSRAGITRQRLEQDRPLWHPDGMGTRVGMIATRCQPEIGGIESHVAEVAGRLVAHGYELEILTTDRSGDLPRVERSDEGYVIRRFRAYPAGRDWYLSPGLFLAALRADYDLVHVQGVHTLVPPMAMLAALLRRRPYLLTFHTGGNSSSFREKAREHPVADPGAAAAARGPADRRLRLRGPSVRRGARLGAGDDHGDPQRRLAARRSGAPSPGCPAGSSASAGSSATRATTRPSRRSRTCWSAIPRRTCRCSAAVPTSPTCWLSPSPSGCGTG